MQTVDERPETIHLYVVREEDTHPSFTPIILSALTLLVLVIVCVAFPYRQPEVRKTLRLPAVFLPVQTFSTSVKIISTGVRTYPATIAHGILTVTNGSVISQTIPQGFQIAGVVFDTTVFVPAGSASGYGYATVLTHALIRGKSGNIPAYAINRVEGSSIYIRNLTPFIGGKDSYSIPLQLPKDRQTALDTARLILGPEKAKLRVFLAYPCEESSHIKNTVLGLSWKCQYVTYSIPSYMHVTHIKLIGKNLFIGVRFVARPRIFVLK